MRGYIKPTRQIAIAFILTASLMFSACGAGTLSKLHDSLNKVAKSLNTAAHTNRSLYEGGIYGAVGSPEAIAMRAKVAKAIHDSNEKLILALNLAKQLKPETFESGKLAVLQALSQAASGLRVGNQAIDLILQATATLITQAVVLIEAFQAKDLNYIVPRIQGWQIAEAV